ncbi:hypothetical protein EKK58_02140 [Candidatus Dependentiae bacterium]|nr:MAG: hypothetical protein EKK58_02140 [Candidatus Dependentiae bacterium]
MKTYYSEKSKYFRSEQEFRASYPNAKIEYHAWSWSRSRPVDKNVIAAERLGYDDRFGKPRRNSMVWLVARN